MPENPNIDHFPEQFSSLLQELRMSYQAYHQAETLARDEVGTISGGNGEIYVRTKFAIAESFNKIHPTLTLALPDPITLHKEDFDPNKRLEDLNEAIAKAKGKEKNMLRLAQGLGGGRHPRSIYYLSPTNEVYTYMPYLPSMFGLFTEDEQRIYDPSSPNFVGIKNLKSPKNQFGSFKSLSKPVYHGTGDDLGTGYMKQILDKATEIKGLNPEQKEKLEETKATIKQIEDVGDQQQLEALRRHGNILMKRTLNLLEMIKKNARELGNANLPPAIFLNHSVDDGKYNLLLVKEGRVVVAPESSGMKKMLARFDLSKSQDIKSEKPGGLQLHKYSRDYSF